MHPSSYRHRATQWLVQIRGTGVRRHILHLFHGIGQNTSSPGFENRLIRDYEPNVNTK